MKKLKIIILNLFGYKPLKLNIVKFDMENNVFQEMFKDKWEENRLYFEKSDYFFIKTISPIVESVNKVEKIKLNNFPYKYKVRRTPMVNSFFIICPELEKYWKDNKTIEIIFYHK